MSQITWEVLDAAEVAELEARPHWTEEHPERRPTNAEQPHCLCGRFAKYVGGQNYYNGQFDCYRYTVRCTRCGDVTIECV